MTVWIACGTIAFAVAVFSWAVAALAGSVRRCAAEARTCLVRAASVSQLEPGLQVTRQRLAALEEPLRQAEQRASGLQSRRGHHPAS